MTDRAPAAQASQTVGRLIRSGSHYRTEVLEELHHDELKTVETGETGGITVLDRKQTMASS